MTPNKSFDSSGAQFAWDSTSLSLAATCLRKYYYKMIEGWQPFLPSVHLVFGAHYATALEHYHKHLALGDDHETALRKIVHEALCATGTRDNDGHWHVWAPLDDKKTRENLIRTIVWYCEEFRDDNLITMKKSDGTPAVEYSFALPVDNDYVLTGHIDRLVEFSADPYVTDNKTTGGTIASYYFKQFDNDAQMSQYTFAGKIIFGVPVKGVIIDGAQIAVGFSRFERYMTMRTESQLTEWYDETMALIERAREHTRENFFPMNRTACGNYGGCEFRDACSRPPEIREQFLKSDFFRGKRWDPLESR